MAQPHDHNSQTGAEPSRNVFVRLQRRFERRFDRFRERYGVLLEHVISRRNAFVSISLAIAVGSMSLFFFLGRDYFPERDRPTVTELSRPHPELVPAIPRGIRRHAFQHAIAGKDLDGRRSE